MSRRPLSVDPRQLPDVDLCLRLPDKAVCELQLLYNGDAAHEGGKVHTLHREGCSVAGISSVKTHKCVGE